VIALLQKDLRLYRAAIITAAIGIVGPYVLIIIVLIWGALAGGSPDGRIFEGFSTLGIWTAIVIAGIFGGSAFSIERRDRTADFLAMLPISRTRVMLSKCAIAAGPILVLWLVHFAVYFLACTSEFHGPGGIFEVFSLSTSAIIIVFGVAWFAGLFVRSPAISASVGLVLLIAPSFLIALHWDRAATKISPVAVIFLWNMVVGIVSFVAGAIIFLVRVAP
jgi:ABC-type transport system involved in multi-copper enzyme maturation permease subunit